MSSSAINAQLFQAKIGSIQNQADSSSVYSAGVWSFKNSTALTSVTITDAGNVGIGTASPSSKLHVLSASDDIARFSATAPYMSFYNGATRIGYIRCTSGGALLLNAESANSTMTFYTGDNERMRIDASGNLLVGKTVSSDTAESGFLVYNPTVSGGGIVTTTTNSSSSGTFTYHLYNRNATFNGYRFYVGVDGGIRNFSANNSSLSDERVKTDIKPAGSYLQKICSIPVKTFRYKDQGDDMDLTLGVIAQEVEAIAPELVNATDGFGDLPEDGVPLKTVYQTDLQYALMKCIQELKEKNDALEARLAALESKP